MSITTQKYIRKPFIIDAIKVTDENIELVAKWCKGTIKTERRGKKDIRYIHVNVDRPMSERQTKAFIGDWVLFSSGNWKVYSHQAFEGSFELYQQDLEVDPNQLTLLGAKYAAGQS